MNDMLVCRERLDVHENDKLCDVGGVVLTCYLCNTRCWVLSVQYFLNVLLLLLLSMSGSIDLCSRNALWPLLWRF